VTRRVAVIAAAALAAACTTTPADPFAAAERALVRHDLAASLRALDAVPVVHARYPEARAAAVTVERSMRRCHELMLEAMLLRSEWRDREALLALHKARAIWPALPGADALIAATEQRLRLLGERDDAAPRRPAPAAAPALSALHAATEPDAVALPPAAPAGDVATPAGARPVARGSAPALPVAPDRASSGADGAGHPVSGATPGAMAARPAGAHDPRAASTAAPATQVEAPGEAATVIASGEDPVALGLVAVETRLGRNQLEPAVADLLELSRRFPNDARVRVRLVRLLHQRALLRYGEGAVAMAVADWRRILEIDPQHGPARRMLDAVEIEGR
jgi:hypothetical protein